MFFWGCLLGSFALVSLGQSAWIPGFGIFAAAFGYTLFWRAMLRLPDKRDQFWLSLGWFAAVQAVQLSWMTATQYMGPLILIIYLLLLLAIGAQFGFLTLFFSQKGISFLGCLAGAGCWVLMEWTRLFLFSGFTWNPVGLALADSSLSIQFASLFGVYGLSFWVIFVNLFAVFAWTTWKTRTVWAMLAIFPYLFGWGHQWWVEKHVPIEKMISAALVQTAILPEQKDRFAHRSEAFIPLLNQWERICQELQQDRPVDLIILPEAAVSMGAHRPLYPMNLLTEFWIEQFGKNSLSDLPPWVRGKATNAYIAQGLANHFNSHVIVGFDDQDGRKKYNAAFHFQPNNGPSQRYEKRILVPIGEYVPFPNLPGLTRFLVEQFGIGDSFDIGTEAKLFFSPLPIGVSICLEETYGELVRDLRLKGARLLVNVSNDVWFPGSSLPQQHFQHGRIRAAENGVYVLRSCNTGVTGGVDCFGDVIAALPPSESEISTLYLNFPLRSFQTLYTWWGDGVILILSACFTFLWFWKKKLPLNGSLS